MKIDKTVIFKKKKYQYKNLLTKKIKYLTHRKHLFDRAFG